MVHQTVSPWERVGSGDETTVHQTLFSGGRARKMRSGNETTLSPPPPPGGGRWGITLIGALVSCIRARCGHPDSSDDSVVPSEYGCLPAAESRCAPYSSVSLKYKTRQHYFIYFAACHVNSVRDICSAVESVSGEDARNQVMLTAEGQQMDPDRVIGSYPTGTVALHLQTVLREPSSPLYPLSHTPGQQANLSVFQDISNLCRTTFCLLACQTKSVSLPPSNSVVFHNVCCYGVQVLACRGSWSSFN